MKKVKKMMFGGAARGVASAAQKAAAAPKMAALAANKPMGMGEGIARAAGVPVGTRVNAPASVMPIGEMRPPGQATTGGPKPAPAGMAGIGNAVRSAVAGQAASQAAGKLGSMAGRMMGMKKGGKVSSASKRADGIAVRGKTKGKMV